MTGPYPRRWRPCLNAGARPQSARADGDALLQALSGRRPDAVITDHNLGISADGFTVLTQLETHWGRALPSLILTGDDQEQINRTGRRVVHKPVWANTLLDALRFEIDRSAQT